MTTLGWGHVCWFRAKTPMGIFLECWSMGFVGQLHLDWSTASFRSTGAIANTSKSICAAICPGFNQCHSSMQSHNQAPMIPHGTIAPDVRMTFPSALHLHFPVQMYSGLQKCCNVWQFWIACDVALYSIGMTLSIAEMK